MEYAVQISWGNMWEVKYIVAANQEEANALAKWTWDEFDEDGTNLAKGKKEYDWMIIYWCFGTWLSYPYTGSIPTNVEYIGWVELPDVKIPKGK